ERLFGTAKEYHNLRYTREKGKSKMEDKIGLTLACLNLKKLVNTQQKSKANQSSVFKPLSTNNWF
ncbi:IS5/IS1182 family transposase, partial [Streptococcus suis]